MKRLAKAISVVICISLCVILSSCHSQYSGSNDDSYSVDDSYIDGVERGRKDFFLDLWNASYDFNIKECGEVWETDSFSLTIKQKLGSRIDAGHEGNENKPYLEIDFTLHNGTIDKYWEEEKLMFAIYAYTSDGVFKVWDSDLYYMYFTMQTDDGKIGNNGFAETAIYGEVEELAVIIVIDGCIYTASFYTSK